MKLTGRRDYSVTDILMAKAMRAKVYVSGIEKHSAESESVRFTAISKQGAYSNDGSDEDNTYAKFSPMAHFNITIANPELIGRYHLGEKYYVDFTPVQDGTQNLEG